MKKPVLQISINPHLLSIVQSLANQRLKTSDSAMGELLIFEALVARKEIDPNITL